MDRETSPCRVPPDRERPSEDPTVVKPATNISSRISEFIQDVIEESAALEGKMNRVLTLV